MLVRLGLLLLTLALPIGAQSFEVASIRLSNARSIRGSEGGPGSKDPTRYGFERASLLDLITIAYDVKNFQVSTRLPLERDEFDLQVRLPPSATKEDFHIMLRNLLAERFRMKLHVESREFPALEMVTAKGGTKLGTLAAARTPADADFPQLSPGKPGLIASNSLKDGHMLTRIRAQQQLVSRLAEILRTAEPRPVVDRTGLTGKYDFVVEFSSDFPDGASDISAPSDKPDLKTALREQLGLELVAKKLPFDVVVVESFTAMPTEN